MDDFIASLLGSLMDGKDGDDNPLASLLNTKAKAFKGMKYVSDILDTITPEEHRATDTAFAGVYAVADIERLSGRFTIMAGVEDMLERVAALRPSDNQVILDLLKEGRDNGVFDADLKVQTVWYEVRISQMVLEENMGLYNFFREMRPTIRAISTLDAQMIFVILTGDLSDLVLDESWMHFQ